MAMLAGGAGGAGSTMISPRTAAASQMLAGQNGKKTIRKTNRMRRLTVEGGGGESGIPSLYGGPVSPDALTPRSMLQEMASQAAAAAPTAPIPNITLDGIKMPKSPTTTQPPAQSPSRNHLRQPSMGSSDLTRSTTLFVQKLEQLCGGVNAVQDASLLTTGNVRSILAVQDNVWVAHNNPSPAPPSIAIYNRDTLIQLPEVKLPDFTVNNMVLAGRQVWLATSGKDLICINPVDPLFQHVLKGHGGSITDLASMGKTLWTISTDQQIGVWEVSTMKLRKMIKGSVMNSIIHVAGVAWIGTVRGIVRYTTDNLKVIKEPVQLGEAQQYIKMAVSKLLLVNNYVWALHHDENMVSVWDAENKLFITAFAATDVVSMLHVGSHVWMTSHNHLIRCYDVTTFTKVGELTGMHQDWVTALTIARRKDSLRVWSGSTDATICIWDPKLYGHEFVAESSCSGNCEVCKKTLKSFGGKNLRCRNCQTFAIHAKCRELMPTGCTCNRKIEQSMVASAAKV